MTKSPPKITATPLNFHWREVYQEVFDSKKKIALTGCIWLLLGIPAVYAMTSVQKNDIAELGTEFIGADGRKTILLEPEKWVGKEFPLFFLFDKEVTQKLRVGSWTVIFYHTDCPKCMGLIDNFMAVNPQKLLCVELPPYKEKSNSHHFPNAKINIKSVEYHFEKTPRIVEIGDGKCIMVR